MDKKRETVDCYNKNAESFAKKFDSLGAHVSEINETLNLIKKDNPKIFEIGCGNGRDAEEIYKRTDNYLGIDIAEGLISLARQKVPSGMFEVSDIESYRFSDNFDAVFAFASLIHVPKESLRAVFLKVLAALKTEGLFRLAMKYANEYREVTKEDDLGTRTFYLYSQKDIEELAEGFIIIKNEIVDFRGKEWMEILIQKPKAKRR